MLQGLGSLGPVVLGILVRVPKLGGEVNSGPVEPVIRGSHHSKALLADLPHRALASSFLVSVVIPGNAFPVVEHPFAADGSANPSGSKGKGCRGGYQSHFTLVDGRDINSAFPVRGSIDPATAADELVTFDTSQALPIFVFYTK